MKRKLLLFLTLSFASALYPLKSHDAAVAAGTTAISFFASRYLKEQISTHILERFIPYFKKEDATPYTLKYAITGGVSHLVVLGIKIAIWKQLYKHPVKGTGETQGPDWLDKAWLLGDALGMIEEGLEGLWSLKKAAPQN